MDLIARLSRRSEVASRASLFAEIIDVLLHDENALKAWASTLEEKLNVQWKMVHRSMS